jgi:hypothetical protein
LQFHDFLDFRDYGDLRSLQAMPYCHRNEERRMRPRLVAASNSTSTNWMKDFAGLRAVPSRK